MYVEDTKTMISQIYLHKSFRCDNTKTNRKWTFLMKLLAKSLPFGKQLTKISNATCPLCDAQVEENYSTAKNLRSPGEDKLDNSYIFPEDYNPNYIKTMENSALSEQILKL